MDDERLALGSAAVAAAPPERARDIGEAPLFPSIPVPFPFLAVSRLLTSHLTITVPYFLHLTHTSSLAFSRITGESQSIKGAAWAGLGTK